MGQANYRKEKDFVKSLAYNLNLNPGKTRTAVIIYSSSARQEIGFTDHTSTLLFDRAIDGLPLLGGIRRIDRALIAAGSVLNSARPSASKVVILLTAGRQAQVSGAQSLDQAMEPLRQHRARTFVIAIGQQADKKELGPVVENPRDIFAVSTFDMLRRHSIPIAKDVRNRTGA